MVGSRGGGIGEGLLIKPIKGNSLSRTSPSKGRVLACNWLPGSSLPQLLLCSSHERSADQRSRHEYPTCSGTESYRQDVIASCCELLSGGDHASFGVNKEFSIIIPVHNTVGDFCIGAFIAVKRKSPVNGFSSLLAVTFGKLDLVDLLWELGLVVIFVQNLNDHPDRRLFWRSPSICHCHLSLERERMMQSGNLHIVIYLFCPSHTCPIYTLGHLCSSEYRYLYRIDQFLVVNA